MKAAIRLPHGSMLNSQFSHDPFSALPGIARTADEPDEHAAPTVAAVCFAAACSAACAEPQPERVFPWLFPLTL